MATTTTNTTLVSIFILKNRFFSDNISISEKTLIEIAKKTGYLRFPKIASSGCHEKSALWVFRKIAFSGRQKTNIYGNRKISFIN